jgi:secondary thiamine-phosphate synthase enzyme
MIKTKKITIDSDGGFSTFIITEAVQQFVTETGCQDGAVIVFFQHTTGAVMLIEHEAGILVDLEEVLERIAPVQGEYQHHRVGYDLNGGLHVRNALLNSSITVPFQDGKLLLGTYQDIMVLDMQMERNPRNIILQVNGE